MSVISKAVLLSYAHEDAAVAAQLAEALRTAEVEVWFDPGEARGGEAWERKARRQTKECALFVPLISQNTQAAKEGDFRVAWRLADERAHAMGKNASLVVPVCIDGTKDAEADVPHAFLEVQWTRLQRRQEGGALDALELSDFAQHVKHLIACGDLQFTPAPFSMTGSPLLAEAPPPPASVSRTVWTKESPPATPQSSAPSQPERRVPVAVWIVVGVVLVAALAYLV